MSMAAILLTLTPMATETAVPAGGQAVGTRRTVAVSVSASARILSPAIISFAKPEKTPAFPANGTAPQRRIERSTAGKQSTVWIEFS